MLRYAEHARIGSFRELKGFWREDVRVNKGFWRPGAQALIMYRLGVWQLGLQRGIVRAIASRLYRFLHVFVRNRYGIELYATANIGRRLLIAHQSAIVLDQKLVMGDDCIIRQGVTLGLASRDVARKTDSQGPMIGNRVEIGAGAIVVGAITIGDDVMIGPNAVVLRSVPSGCLVTSTPARVISRPPRGEPKRSDVDSQESEIQNPESRHG
ncbi:MAG: serine acetyltransferase [Pirellulaceae bacterium]